MRIRRYDHGYSRRVFLDRLARGVLAGGVLMPLWKAIAATGDIDRAYPEELLSLEAWTRGKLRAGDTISADNVEQVRDLLDPIQYLQVAQMGRRLTVLDTTTDVMRLSPPEYIEATLSNRGRARFAPDGNVVTDEGKPWIGGNPFPEPRDGIEVFAGVTLSWGRHDAALYAVREYDLDDSGAIAYEYQSCWSELAPVGRLRLEPRPYWTGHEDKLRYQSVLFLAPHDVRGTSFLNIWHYDQNRYPELYGYLPAFKRVRRFPTNQRFEPLIPGSTLYLSDAWAAGDPLLTWGNYRIVHQGPALGAVSRSWNAAHPNWEHGTHGGARGLSFWDTAVEFVPEVIVVEAEPLKYPRAPVGRKRVWFDARTLLPLSMVSYDRQGRIFRSFDGAFSVYEDGGQRVMDGVHPYWSWTRVHAHDVQTNRITRLEQVKELPGGYRSQVNDAGIYDKYLTQTALTRLGA
jgi:hypothetical protein